MMKLKSLSDLERLLSDSHSETPPSQKKHDGKRRTVRISLDTKGRKGKSVTLIEGLQHNPDTMREIARMLKEHCGTGGTVKNGVIELQGDQRARATAKLRDMNYAPIAG